MKPTYFCKVSIPHRYDTNERNDEPRGKTQLLVSIPHRYDTNGKDDLD